ncbi:hypothetical protein D3C86_2019180 [compost metagenome]
MRAVEFLGGADMPVQPLADSGQVLTQAGIAAEHAIAQATMALKAGDQRAQQGQLANVQLDMLAFLPLQAPMQAIEQQACDEQGGGAGEQEGQSIHADYPVR